MATNLANRLFSHPFITIVNVLPNHINFAYVNCEIINRNLFAYIIIDQYSSNKFYEIIIDTGIFKHSTAGYGQFIAYTRNIKYTTSDISKADAIHVQFGIVSISSMGSVLIQTPIGHIKFYILKADTFFLLCPIDMDWLDVYFNNINNF